MSVHRLHSEATPSQKFSSPAAHLYEYINVQNGVRTPDGLGTLRQAFTSVCLVEPSRGPLTGSYGNSKQTYRPMKEYQPREVRPA